MEVEKLWEEKKVFKRMLEKNRGKRKKFYYLHGPPYVTNIPHVGNMRNYVYQDVLIRYKIMKGFDVFTRPGLDTHGLPIEVAVEKELGIKDKGEIKKMGVDKFIEECRKWVEKYAPEFKRIFKMYGLLYGEFDLKDWYVTCRDEYIERCWKYFKKAWEKGLVYFGEEPRHWCPRCQTILSTYEISDSYIDKEDPSIFVKFPVKGEEKTYFLVWTTTPWTLPANVALCVHPDETYVKVKVDDEYLILAEARLLVISALGKKFEVVEKFLGKDLEGMEYEPVIDTEEQRRIKHRVVLSIPILKGYIGSKMAVKKKVEVKAVYEHLVSMSEGTGIVHIAPAHGREDYLLGKHYGLEMLNVVDEEGRLINAGPFNGLYFKEADKKIIEYLKERGLLFHADTIVHRYPICWRCKTPLTFRVSKEIFISIEKIREKLLDASENITFYPEGRKKQFQDIILNAQDWPISRRRYWGIPIPLWECENCGNLLVIDSKEELERLSGKKIKELHIPHVDVEIPCPKCGKPMKRVPFVFDVWWDSGCAPYASVTDEEWEKYKVVDAVMEGQDQVGKWFYTLHVLGVIMFDRNVYENCGVVGWVLDAKGRKMSKSLGNVIYADEAIEKAGVDAVRFYYLYATPLSETMNFDLEEAKKIGHQLTTVFVNTAKFLRDYLKRAEEEGELKLEDKWILEYTKKVVKEIGEHIEKFEFREAAHKIRDLIVEKISRFYVKAIRERARKERKPLEVLGEVLKLASIAAAPILVKSSEEVYQILKECGFVKGESVHLEDWPEIKEYDEKIIEKMEKVMTIIDAILSLRERAGIKWRWVLKECYYEKELDEEEIELIKRFANVEEVKIKSAGGDFVEETKYGKVGISKEIDREYSIFREICRRIQEIRKKKGLKVYEKAKLIISEDVKEIIEKFIDELKERCNFEEVVFGEGEEEIEIKDFGIKFKVGVEK